MPFTQQDWNNAVSYDANAEPPTFSISGVMVQQPDSLPFLSFFRADLTSSSMGAELDMPGSSTATTAAYSNFADGTAGGWFYSWTELIKMLLPAPSLHCLLLLRMLPASRMGLETAIESERNCLISQRRPWLDRMTEPSLPLLLFRLTNADDRVSTVPCKLPNFLYSSVLPASRFSRFPSIPGLVMWCLDGRTSWRNVWQTVRRTFRDFQISVVMSVELSVALSIGHLDGHLNGLSVNESVKCPPKLFSSLSNHVCMYMSTMADNIIMLAAASVVITVRKRRQQLRESRQGRLWCQQWPTRRRSEQGMEHFVLNELALTDWILS